MKIIPFFLFLISFQVSAEQIAEVKDDALSMILGTLRIAYESNRDDPVQVRVVVTDEVIGECWGKISTCPDVRLFIVVSNGDLYETPKVFELPKSKGWARVISTRNKDSVILKIATELPGANISQEERSTWNQKIFSVVLKTDQIPTISVD
jgi:hypothetical protein